MTSQDTTPFHWQYTELDDQNFRLRGRTLFYVVVLFGVVLLSTLLFLYARWVCRYRQHHDHDSPPAVSVISHSYPPPLLPSNHSLGLDLPSIHALPIVLHGAVPFASDGSESECSICLGAFEDGDKVKVLPQCQHRYHCECVDRWLATRSVCPLCRAPLRRVDSAV